jgi:hypothetical protein
LQITLFLCLSFPVQDAVTTPNWRSKRLFQSNLYQGLGLMATVGVSQSYPAVLVSLKGCSIKTRFIDSADHWKLAVAYTRLYTHS